jgi:2-phospho-L-lactate guanylyltransferase
MSAMHVLIPCKSLDAGKSRLSECLDAAARRALCERLLAQTIALALAASAPARIRVVTSDRDAAATAAARGIAALPDRRSGLKAALNNARHRVMADGAEAILTLPIDLPFATPDALAAAAARAADVVIGPDESDAGTNLLLLRGMACQRLTFAFGPRSHAAHLAAAQASGLSVETLRDPRIAFDIDSSAQYAAWRDRIARRDHSVAN